MGAALVRRTLRQPHPRTKQAKTRKRKPSDLLIGGAFDDCRDAVSLGGKSWARCAPRVSPVYQSLADVPAGWLG